MPDTLPARRGRRPAPPREALPVICVPALQLWSQRECSAVLSVSREAVSEAVRSGALPSEPRKLGQRSRRVLAADAVRVLAPAWLSRLQFV
jgi:hypothetical protein